MANRSASEKTLKGRQKLKEIREKKNEAKMRHKEEMNRLLGRNTRSSKPRSSQKRATFSPGHHGNK